MSTKQNFTSSVKFKTCKLNHRLNCEYKCLIYLLTCKKFFKQYVCETAEIFAKDGTTAKVMPGSL